MSSYLTFYIEKKDDESISLEILSVSRNSELYQSLSEHIYAGQKIELTKEIVKQAIEEIRAEVYKAKARIDEYYNHLPDKLDDRMQMIDNVISLKEDMCEMEQTWHDLLFIYDIVEQTSYNDNKVVVEID